MKPSDAHKKAMNRIYQKPLYPEVWDEEEVRRAERPSPQPARRTTKPKLIRRQGTLL